MNLEEVKGLNTVFALFSHANIETACRIVKTFLCRTKRVEHFLFCVVLKEKEQLV